MKSGFIRALVSFLFGITLFIACEGPAGPPGPAGEDGEDLSCDYAPVVLNGDTIHENRIIRNAYGCVTEIDLSELGLTDSNCIHGIEPYISTLQELRLDHNSLTTIDLSPLEPFERVEILNLGQNDLTSIDLSPLSSWTTLEWINLIDNELVEIDLSPLTNCINLYVLPLRLNNLTSIDLSPITACLYLEDIYLDGNQLTSVDVSPLYELEYLGDFRINVNDLDSATCADICDFIEARPDCYVQHDCDCGR